MRNILRLLHSKIAECWFYSQSHSIWVGMNKKNGIHFSRRKKRCWVDDAHTNQWILRKLMNNSMAFSHGIERKKKIVPTQKKPTITVSRWLVLSHFELIPPFFVRLNQFQINAISICSSWCTQNSGSQLLKCHIFHYGSNQFSITTNIPWSDRKRIE